MKRADVANQKNTRLFAQAVCSPDRLSEAAKQAQRFYRLVAAVENALRLLF